MTVEPEIRQRLLELAYDLLPAGEAADLRKRIDADPELARAYADAESTSQLFGEAARLESPRLALKRPERSVETSGEPVRPKAPARGPGPAAAPWKRGANWAVAVAAGLLLLISIGGYLRHRGQLADIAADHLRLRVTGPAKLQAGVENRYSVTTTAVTGTAMPAQIEFALYSPDGKQLMGHKEKTDKEGRLQVTIPADMLLSSRAKLRILARERNQQEEVNTRLAVEPVGYVTRLSLDKPLYRPGETIGYRSLTLSRFGLTADRPMPIHFEILDPGGAVVAGSELEGVSHRGVGCGQFPIPEELPGGQYTLVTRSLDDAFPEERRTFFIRRYRLPRLKKELEFTRDSYAPGDTVLADFSAERAEGGPAAGAALRVVAAVDGKVVHQKTEEASPDGTFQIEFALPREIERGDGQLLVVVDDGGTRETIAKTLPINLGKLQVSFFPEGGDLVAGLENRVYFVGRDPLGEPVHIRGAVVDSEGHGVVGVETTHQGMGAFSFVPRPGEHYRLKVDTPADADGELKLPKVSSNRSVVLNTGLGAFQAGKPLEFNVRAAEAGLPLVASASCRGVPVGHQPFITQEKANSVAIPLGDEVGGVIRLTIYDYSSSPPEPVAERLVYRRPARRLQVRVAGHDERYSPGEEVELSLVVTDEDGKPVPAVLGVAVVDDALLSLADDDTPAMPTHFLLTTEVENPQDLEEADFYLSDGEEAAVALDLLLGTQGWRRFVEKTLEQLREEGRDHEQLVRLASLGGEADPPAVFDNLIQLQGRYQESLANYRANRTRTLNTLTALSFFGGMGLVLLVAMLSLLNIASGVRLWAPAVGVATVCVVVGAVLMNPERLKSGPQGEVAFLPFDLEPAATGPATGSVVEEAVERERRKQLGLPGEDAKEFLDDAAVWDVLALDEKLAAPAARPAADEEALKLLEEHRGEQELKKKQRDLRGWVEDKDLGQLADLGRALRGGRLGEKDRLGALREDLAKNLEKYRFTVREYSHQHQPGSPGVRSDFAETLYWHPLLQADADGRAQLRFDLSDSVTTFRVLADAHADGGRIGSGSGEVISRIPFNLEPKLPLEVNAGDTIDLPLAVVNDTNRKLPVELVLEHGDQVRLEGDPARQLELLAEQRGRQYFALEVVGQKGDCPLTFRGTAGGLADAVQRSLRVVPPGFPKNLSYSGRLEGDQELVVPLPEDWVPGSLEVALNVFPSTLADLQQGMEGILREPCGCFEQASTSNYPNVLSLEYMQEHDVAKPAVTRRAKDLLKKGYVKLAGYESPKQGYEWFGGDPGHEALTAYGLMEFRDMAGVYDVDPQMIDRTAKWLLERRDGKGRFKRNPKALDSFGGAPPDITDAYITWALSESGQEGIEAEVRHVTELAAKSGDPYLVALAAAAAINAGEEHEGKKLLDKLAEARAEDGHLEGTRGSITRSGGHSLAVETTALAALAWMKLPDYTEQANRAVEWIITSRQGSGGFGSTQATILALKAFVEHAKLNRRTVNDGKLIVKRDDAVIGEQAFAAGCQETLSLDGLEAKLQSGDNRLVISLSGNNKLPYALDVSYRSQTPADDDACPVRLSTRLAKQKIPAGETVTLTAKLTNTTGEGQPMTVAILGLPAGLEVRPDQLEEVKKAGTIDYYETRAREVICYWRDLAPEEKVDLKLDLVAAVPGKYTGPASRAYLYYTAEQKQWTAPLTIEITRD